MIKTKTAQQLDDSLRNLVDEPQLYLVFGANKLILVHQHAEIQC